MQEKHLQVNDYGKVIMVAMPFDLSEEVFNKVGSFSVVWRSRGIYSKKDFYRTPFKVISILYLSEPVFYSIFSP